MNTRYAMLLTSLVCAAALGLSPAGAGVPGSQSAPATAVPAKGAPATVAPATGTPAVGSTAVGPVAAGVPVAVAPASVAARDALLTQAFDIASSIPADPHERDRSRAQQDVALACLDLGLVAEAQAYALRIDGWRRGEALALAGRRYAANKDSKRAADCAALARASVADDESWSHERVMALVGGIYLVLGDEAAANESVRGIAQQHLGTFEAVRTGLVPLTQLDAQGEMFDKAVALGNFDFTRSAVEGYLALIERVHADGPRMARALASVDAAFKGLPLDLQVGYRAAVAQRLATLGHAVEAKEQLSRAAQVCATTTFQAEDIVPLGVVVARTRIRLGDRDGARKDLQRLRGEYAVHRNGIVDLRRGASLRALAEAYAELGERDRSLLLYAEALDAGALNPNARPRAEDLSATCLSMAVSRTEPTPEMLRRTQEIRASLADPW